jgi:hypothetical protein
MELVDRYLKSVRSALPEAQRDDIIKELSENIRSQMEDKESELGRPLNELEVEAILKQHGHPLLVAGRYRQDHRTVAFGHQWIGPTLFPFYIKVLSFNLGLTSVVLLIIFFALFAAGQSFSIFPTFLYQLLIQFGIVTLIFAVADRHWTKFPDRWDPRSLKTIWHPGFATQTGSVAGPASQPQTDPTRISCFESISQFVALGVSIVWLRVAQRSPFMIFGPAAAFFKLAPVWHQFYLPVVLLALAGMLQAGINLFRPDWVRLRSVFRIGSAISWLLIWLFLFRAGTWVVLADLPGTPAEGYLRTVAILNQCLYFGLLGASFAAVVDLLRHLHRLTRRPSSHMPSQAL